MNFKHIIICGMGIISLFTVVFAKRTAPDYFSENATIFRVGTGTDNKALPLVIFLPATDMHAEKLYKRFGAKQGMTDYIALIPAGKPKRSEYESDFWSYLLKYEENLLSNIALAQKSYRIDTQQIYLEGFSLGGDLAWALMVRNKELFAGATILGSRMSYPIKKAELQYFKNHNKAIVLLMGDLDDIDRQKGMINQQKLLEKNKNLLLYHMRSGGHTLPSNDLYELSQLRVRYHKKSKIF